MLVGTDMVIEEVALQCGFKSERAFSEALMKHEHITPYQLRNVYKDSLQVRFFDK